MVMQSQQQQHQQQQQQQQQQPRPDSPADNSFNPSFPHHNLKPSLHTADPLFNLHSQQNPSHAMYNSIHIPPDYSSDHEKQSQAKMNGFAPYRTSASFNSFPNNNRPRHPPTSLSSGPYRDASFFPTAADVFPSGPPLGHMTSPTLQHHQLQQNSFDLQQARGFDYTGSQQNNHPKQSYGLVDTFPSSALLQSHQVGSGKSLHSVQQQHNGYQTPFVNGLHIQSQTPYGPHLQTNGTSANGTAGSGPTPSINHVSAGAAPPNPSQEEISTIFVVGFPEDMQEREFQNMFTFSAGFEAATLKIPNKEYNAYGGTATAPPGGMRPGANGIAANYPQSYSGSNDPYNLVTVNQGGVVVDGGRDGTMASWPASVPGMAQDDGGHFVPGGGVTGVQSMPPRKQIIGFAKFRSRSEALEARDVLQGRRVDIEKGAVLKAEMAKKNLHTKRGVGPLPMPTLPSMAGGGLGPNSSEALGLGPGGGMIGGLGGETMTIRERELGALGAMSLGGMNHWRETSSRMPDNNRADEEERERKRDREAGVLNAMGLGAAGTRGPRERAEEDERERERRRKEKEARLRSSGMTAFDAFHSVPPVISRHTSTSTGMLSPGSGPTDNGSPMIGNGFSHSLSHSSAQDEINESVNPWDGRKMPMTLTATPTVPISRQSSPPNRDHGNNAFSPSSNNNVPLPQRMFSPSLEDNQRYSSQETSQFSSQEISQYPLNKRIPTCSSSQPASSASSVIGGSQSGHVEGEITRAFGALAVTTNHGNTSPQLPSPASGVSSTSTRNIVDQNPPINTLYVGNLPTSQVPSGYPPNYLEDSLRELFQRRPGFRKLCFRQKSNGPMCFVEFDDVSFATKTLNDMYGNTLGGLIKGGGIRLSYSKNPLGVRTPTSAGSNGPSLQQQQLQNNGSQPSNGPSPFSPDAFQSRLSVDVGAPSVRREIAVTSPPPPSYNYMMSPPPPRFFSPTPSNSSNFPRVNQHVHGYGLPPGNSSISSFSPFGLSSPQHPTIPDLTSSDPHDHHFTQGVLSSANNIEAARAG